MYRIVENLCTLFFLKTLDISLYLCYNKDTVKQRQSKEEKLMKAAKYVMFTDHKADYNRLDSFTRLDAGNILEAMAEVIDKTSEDDKLYMVTVYELVSGTKGTQYKPILENRDHNGFVPCTNDPYVLIRETYRDGEWFNLEVA